MIVKRFSGKTVEEALIRAKWELGDEAVLLSSGPAKDRWWKFWERGYQVLAATDYPVMTAGDLGVSMPPGPGSGSEVAVTASVGHPLPAQDDRFEDVMARLIRVEEKMAQGLGPPLARAENPDQALYAHLQAMEWDEKWVRELTAPVTGSDSDGQLSQVQAEVTRRLEVVPPLNAGQMLPRVVVVMGPSGAGKTTTIAKLAGQLGVEDGKKVLLITTDTFRVAASEQLQTFGALLDMPVAVAKHPGDIGSVMQQYPADVVLIDTPGHSVQDPLGIRSGRSVVKHSGASDVLLCIPVTYARSAFVDTARKIAGDMPAALCLTKVDETLHPGAVFSALMELSYPVMYITTGQQVPRDIESTHENHHFMRWLVQGGAYHG